VSAPPRPGVEPTGRLAALAELGASTAALVHELRHGAFVVQAAAAGGDPDRVRDAVADLVALLDLYGSLVRADGTPEAVDVAAEIRALAPVLVRLGRARGVGVTVDAPDDAARVRAMPLGPRQILLNLFHNALDAAQGAAPAQVRVQVRVDAGAVVLVVEDSGPGVDPALVERIFEPWVTTRGAQGTGLGLALCRARMDADGGVIEVGTGASGGARFVARWPGVGADPSPG
jgi:C4-dicarboxylate-specific signal transduction histidine kinase